MKSLSDSRDGRDDPENPIDPKEPEHDGEQAERERHGADDDPRERERLVLVLILRRVAMTDDGTDEPRDREEEAQNKSHDRQNIRLFGAVFGRGRALGLNERPAPRTDIRILVDLFSAIRAEHDNSPLIFFIIICGGGENVKRNLPFFRRGSAHSFAKATNIQ